MLLTLFAFFVAFSLALSVIGFYTGDAAVSLVGVTMLFLVSVSFLTTGLDYQTGTVHNVTYTYDNTTLISTGETETFSYSQYENRTIAFYLVVMAALGFAYILYTLKGERWR